LGWADIALVDSMATRLVATVFWLQVIDKRRHSPLRTLCAHLFVNSN